MIDLIIHDNDARNYLIEKRTSQAIGSHITEAYFEQLFLSGLDESIKISKDWCSAYDFDQNLKFFFIIRNTASQFDEELASILERNNNVSVWLVYIENREIFLKRVIQPTQELIYYEFAHLYHLTDLGFNPNFIQPSRDADESSHRINYCNYMSNNNILIPAANNAQIVDYFIGRYFPRRYGDIDFIVKNRIGINVIEVKFKYRSFSGTFGINRLECKTLKDFNDVGMRVYNIIMDNRNRQNVLDYISLGPEQSHWLYYRFHNYEEGNEQTAPDYTAYRENRPQNYYEFPASQYRLLTYAHNILDLSCPVCGANMVLRHRQRDGHEFMGCSNYMIDSCNGIISIDL